METSKNWLSPLGYFFSKSLKKWPGIMVMASEKKSGHAF